MIFSALVKGVGQVRSQPPRAGEVGTRAKKPINRCSLEIPMSKATARPAAHVPVPQTESAAFAKSRIVSFDANRGYLAVVIRPARYVRCLPKITIDYRLLTH
jgi:hypothetical protein